MPPTTTAQRARPAWTASTRSRTSPSSIRTSWPGWSTWPITAGRTGSSPSTLPSSPPVTTTSSPSASSIGASSSPMRSFGPWRSAISAIGRPTSSWRLPDHARVLGVLLVRPVREVEACAVHPGLRERDHTLLGRARRAERDDDLRAAGDRGRHLRQRSESGIDRSFVLEPSSAEISNTTRRPSGPTPRREQ